MRDTQVSVLDALSISSRNCEGRNFVPGYSERISVGRSAHHRLTSVIWRLWVTPPSYARW